MQEVIDKTVAASRKSNTSKGWGGEKGKWMKQTGLGEVFIKVRPTRSLLSGCMPNAHNNQHVTVPQYLAPATQLARRTAANASPVNPPDPPLPFPAPLPAQLSSSLGVSRRTHRTRYHLDLHVPTRRRNRTRRARDRGMALGGCTLASARFVRDCSTFRDDPSFALCSLLRAQLHRSSVEDVCARLAVSGKVDVGRCEFGRR